MYYCSLNFIQVFPQASTMVDKLQESLHFYKEMSVSEEQEKSPTQRTSDSEKAKDSSKDENYHFTQQVAS